MNRRLHDHGLVPGRADRARGFTLIEVMVVVTIISLLLGMMIMGVRSLMGKSPEISATNQVSAMLGAARSRAMKENKHICVYFFTSSDETEVFMRMGELHDQRELTVVDQNGTLWWVGGWGHYVFRFKPMDDRPPERLPKRVAVASTSFESGLGNWRGPNFMIWFSPEGKAVTGIDAFDTFASWIELDDSGAIVSESRSARPADNITTYSTEYFERMGIGALRGCWSEQDVFAPWDPVEAQDREQNQQKANAWLSQNAKPIIFNRYSGNVMRQR